MAEETVSPAAPPPLPVISVAGRWLRLVAALLDFTIISLVAFFLLSKFLWPEQYPEVYSGIQQWYQEVNAEIEAAVEANEPIPEFTEPPVDQDKMSEMMAYSLAVFSTLVWAYFFISESLMKGSSLGKSVFSMRVISLRSGLPPTALEAALRATIKAFCFLSPGIFLPINLGVLAFNRQRQSGHDLLAKTIVVSGYYYSPPQPSADQPG